jgi:Ser/Thr protein kinase RdoA (MazF antagonist)
MLDQTWLASQGLAALPGVYVPGERLRWQAVTAAALGAMLGRLHRLTPPAGTFGSWYHPLTSAVDEVAAELAAFPALQAALAHAGLVEPCPLTLIHADLWRGNIIAGSDGALTLIDWEFAGLGQAILDLADAAVDCGSHEWIRQLLTGYEAIRPLSLAERAALAPAMQLTIAIRVARKLAAGRRDSIPRELARFAFACIAADDS